MTVSKSTIVRTVMIIIVLINLLLEKLGLDIIKTNQSNVALVIEYLIEATIIIVGWWYNNSFSQKALKAQQFLIELRNENN